MKDGKNIFKGSIESLSSSIFAVLLAFLVGGILIALAGQSPLEAYLSLFNGAFGSAQRFAETIIKAIPLIIIGLGVSIAFKAQIWNIGGDGQFTLGAIFAVFIALNLPLPNVILLPLTFIGAFLGGAIWGGLAGFLKARFNANEVITTLMMNYIAVYLLEWLVKGPMMDPNGHGFPQTQSINKGLFLPVILKGTRLHAGLIVALLLIVMGYYFWKTTLGFKIQIIGKSADVANYSGIKVNRMLVLTMVISAGLTGIAGWVEVFAIHHRLLENISGGLGNLAIVVALLADLNPLGIVVSGLFFSSLVVGGNTMQRMVGIPFSLVDVIQGLVIIFVISRAMYRRGRGNCAGKNINSRIFNKLAGRSN